MELCSLSITLGVYIMLKWQPIEEMVLAVLEFIECRREVPHKNYIVIKNAIYHQLEEL